MPSDYGTTTVLAKRGAMAKESTLIHPVEAQDVEEYSFPTKMKQKDFLNAIVQRVTCYEKDRGEWVDRIDGYYERRYCRLFRDTDWPWPGASDAVMPTIDMTGDRLKTSITQMANTNPMVVFETTIGAMKPQARTDEIYFNHLLRHRIPGFLKQVMYCLDAFIHEGQCIWKVYWDYRTRITSRSIKTAMLPDRYGQLARQVMDNIMQQERQYDPLSTQIPTKKRMREIADAVQEIVAAQIARDYGVTDGEDTQAVRDIVAGLKTKDEEIGFRFREVEANYPRAVLVNNRDFIVPPTATDVQDADIVVHQLWLDVPTFLQRAHDLKWDRDTVKRILAKSKGSGSAYSGSDYSKTGDSSQGVHWSGRSSSDWIQDSREGIQSTKADFRIRVWEVYKLHDIKDRGHFEKCVMVMSPEDTEAPLKKIKPLPYHHGKWPFVQARFEENDPRFYSSRSLGEKIDDIDRYVTQVHRAKLNNYDLLAPTFKYKDNGLFPENMTFVPGRMFPVMQSEDFEAVQVPDRTINFEREENFLLAWNERYIGSLDALSSQQNISEARTAAEVNQIGASGRLALAARGQNFMLGLREVYGQMWDLVNQFGDPEDYERVTGAPMVKRTSIEIQRDYTIAPIGTIESIDPNQEAVRSERRFATLYQLWLQTGGIIDGHKINIAEALLRWLERDNAVDARTLVRQLTEQEMAQIAQAQERKQAVNENQPVSLSDLKAEVEQLKKESPNAGRQRIAV